MAVSVHDGRSLVSVDEQYETDMVATHRFLICTQKHTRSLSSNSGIMKEINVDCAD